MYHCPGELSLNKNQMTLIGHTTQCKTRTITNYKPFLTVTIPYTNVTPISIPNPNHMNLKFNAPTAPFLSLYLILFLTPAQV